MNIFALCDSPVLAAQVQHDKHVVKMTLESAQLISTALRLRSDWLDHCPAPSKLYKTTHKHHPCSKWSRMNANNFRWLCNHGLALAREYQFRFWRTHKSQLVIQLGLEVAKKLPILGNGTTTPFAMAMPDKYKTNDPVLSYRMYYLAEKVKPDSKWTDRRATLPDWLFEKSLLVN